MAFTEETGDALQLGFDEETQKPKFFPWFRDATLEDIAIYQEAALPSVGCTLHDEGWWEIRHWEGDPLIGIFIPKSLNITDTIERINQIYCAA